MSVATTDGLGADALLASRGKEGGDPLLEAKGLEKSFGLVPVLVDVDITLRSHQIHGLLGANGAGKSTLVKVLTGYHEPSKSQMLKVRGADAHWPLEGSNYGIAVVHQDHALVDGLSVTENLCSARRPKASLLSPIRRRKESKECEGVLQRVGLTIDPSTDVAALAPEQRALVVIGRALLCLDDLGETLATSPILILDEPSAALSLVESRLVFAQVKALAAAGTAVLLITHRLEEMREVADVVSILRNGTIAYSGPMPDGNAEIERMMFGSQAISTPTSVRERALPAVETIRPGPPPVVAGTSTVLRVSTAECSSEDDQLTASEGEVVGVTGLVGSGYERLPYDIIGAISGNAVNVILNDVEVRLNPRSASAAGIRLVPGNRARDALWTGGTVLENLLISVRPQDRMIQPLRKRIERTWAKERIARGRVTPNDPAAVITTLSGGNQQKVVMARWAEDPSLKILLAHEPTQGIDLNARRFILSDLLSLAHDRRCCVVVFSADYEAIADVADRIVIWKDGRAREHIPGGLTDRELETRVLLGSQA